MSLRLVAKLWSVTIVRANIIIPLVFIVLRMKDPYFTMNISDQQQFALICILLAGIWCASFAFECTPERGYEGCACYRERNSTKEYVNLLPLKTNSSSPR